MNKIKEENKVEKIGILVDNIKIDNEVLLYKNEKLY